MADKDSKYIVLQYLYQHFKWILQKEIVLRVFTAESNKDDCLKYY